MRAKWRRGAIAFLMGCLVGPYTGVLPSAVAAVVVSALALALPATISVLVDRAIPRRAAAVAWVAGTALLLGIPLVWSAANPAVWQGYSNDAAGISLLAEMLLAPLAAAFALGTTSETGAIICALLAWTGIGIQNLVLWYLVPFVRGLFAILFLNAPINRGGLGYGFLPVVFIVAFLCVLYAIGFALASATGLIGWLLRRRLTRPQRVPPLAHVT